MPLPTQITDYTTFDVPPYLIEFFRGTDLAAYAAALDTQYDELEQACFDVINQLWLDIAVGSSSTFSACTSISRATGWMTRATGSCSRSRR